MKPTYLLILAVGCLCLWSVVASAVQNDLAYLSLDPETAQKVFDEITIKGDFYSYVRHHQSDDVPTLWENLEKYKVLLVGGNASAAFQLSIYQNRNRLLQWVEDGGHLIMLGTSIAALPEEWNIKATHVGWPLSITELAFDPVTQHPNKLELGSSHAYWHAGARTSVVYYCEDWTVLAKRGQGCVWARRNYGEGIVEVTPNHLEQVAKSRGEWALQAMENILKYHLHYTPVSEVITVENHD